MSNSKPDVLRKKVITSKVAQPPGRECMMMFRSLEPAVPAVEEGARCTMATVEAAVAAAGRAPRSQEPRSLQRPRTRLQVTRMPAYREQTIAVGGAVAIAEITIRTAGSPGL